MIELAYAALQLIDPRVQLANLQLLLQPICMECIMEDRGFKKLTRQRAEVRASDPWPGSLLLRRRPIDWRHLVVSERPLRVELLL